MYEKKKVFSIFKYKTYIGFGLYFVRAKSIIFHEKYTVLKGIGLKIKRLDYLINFFIRVQNKWEKFFNVTF
jgi:hypothetical protein